MDFSIFDKVAFVTRGHKLELFNRPTSSTRIVKTTRFDAHYPVLLDAWLLNYFFKSNDLPFKEEP